MQWPKLKLGTRPSRLAQVQVRMVCQALEQTIPDLKGQIEVITYDTPGDRDHSSTLEDLGGRGVFTDTLDACVESGEVDFVVHAMKDMPPELSGGLTIAATLQRGNPCEVLVAPQFSCLSALPHGAVIGSSSVRRRALLRRIRPDLNFTLLRGNVEERIAQVNNGACDATILAHAGMQRLGLLAHAKQAFPLDVLPPDPAQAAIGIVCHRENFLVRRALQQISHKPTFAEVTAERALLKSLPTPDALAIGAIARVHQDTLSLNALLVSENGRDEYGAEVVGSVQDAAALGSQLGLRLREPALRLVSA